MTTAITPVEFDDLEPALREALRGRYERLGYLGDFFGLMAHQPDALRHFDAFTEALKAALGPVLTELVALTVATRLRNDYERHQHERLAVARGLDASWVADVEALDPDRLPGDQATVQRFALAAIDGIEHGGGGSPSAFAAVVAGCGDATSAAVALLVARFVGHAVVAAACQLTPPVRSIFASPSGPTEGGR